MARPPLRGLLAGFTAGAAAGWLVGLLRTPTNPPDDTGAQAAALMPQESFGTAPVETVRKADDDRASAAPVTVGDAPAEAAVAAPPPTAVPASSGDVADVPAVEPSPPAAAASAAASVAPRDESAESAESAASAASAASAESAASAAEPGATEPLAPRRRVVRLDEATTAAFDSAAARPKRVRKKAAPALAPDPDAGAATAGSDPEPSAPAAPRRRPRKALPPTADEPTTDA